MMISKQFRKLAVVAAAAALALSGCAPTPTETVTPTPTPTPTETIAGKVQVVTSTNVYASIAEFIGGDQVEVEAIISDPSQDPHSYEASARDQLLLSDADLVIANGGGYDEFVHVLLDALDEPPFLIEAVEERHDDSTTDESGHSHSNEHVWYDLEEMGHFATHIAETLTALKPDATELFAKNLEVFEIEIENLMTRTEALSDRVLGQELSVIALEPVAERLLEFAGFVDLTPEELRDAIEEEREIPATALQQARDSFSAGEVDLLVTNLQVIDSQMEDLQSAAEASGVPVLTMSELIPAEVESGDYIDWMNLNIDRLQELFY